MPVSTNELVAALDSYAPTSEQESIDVARIRATLGREDIVSRVSPLHVTASALIVHVPTRRVLLRWHTKMGAWMQVGGHFDPGETDPWAVVRREAREETGLGDLVAMPGEAIRPVQVVIVPVPASGDEAAHEHADVRYLLTTDHPEAATPETSAAILKWLPIETASSEVGEQNLRVFLARAAATIDAASASDRSA